MVRQFDATNWFTSYNGSDPEKLRFSLCACVISIIYFIVLTLRSATKCRCEFVAVDSTMIILKHTNSTCCYRFNDTQYSDWPFAIYWMISTKLKLHISFVCDCLHNTAPNMHIRRNFVRCWVERKRQQQPQQQQNFNVNTVYGRLLLLNIMSICF